MEIRLSAVLSEFARTLGTDFPIQGILDHLVGRIVDVLPITGAGVTLISPGSDPRYVAASDDAALGFEQLQTRLAEGPCLAAYTSGEAVSVPDLHDDDRFPTFAPLALEDGLTAVFTFPLRQGEENLGALDLYRSTAGPLDDRAMEAAQTLADVAAAYLLNAQARADLRETSERVLESSLHDALTGLPNRTLLVQRLGHAILRCRRSGKMVAVLFVDLDLFKAVNDTYGHHVGDLLLAAVADRLTSLLRAGDTVARLSGDEFVILCEDLDDASQVEMLAARINHALTEPFLLARTEIQISASVGIAFAGKGDAVPEKLLQDADGAMYRAKRDGGGRHAVVDLRHIKAADRRAELDDDVRGAVGRGELQLHYQPIVDATERRVTGMEAFVRWHHPVDGLLPPRTVIPLATQTGVVHEVGRWVLTQACVDRRRWQRQVGDRRLGVTVNVSAMEVMAGDFVETVEAVLQGTGTEPDLVTLDFTEAVLLRDRERALVVLGDLKKVGVRLALDDFGTGYSALEHLMLFPLDIVKIDVDVVASLVRNPANRALVGAVVAMAHGLNQVIVAEGVESAEQFDALSKLGCDGCQGYYFARPGPAAEVDELLAGRAVTLPVPASAGK